MPNCFGKRPEQVLEIIKLCKEYQIPITGTVFQKHPKELENTINFIREEYGEDYLLPSIVICDKEHIQRVFAYLKGKRCLEVVKTSPSILRLTIMEIVERESIIKNLDQPFIVGDRFNPIFGLSRKNYLEKKKEWEESRKQK